LFYEDTLGLKALPRPDLGFPGRWYDLGNGQQLHLMSVADMPGHADPPRHDRHIALGVPDVQATERQLREMGVAISYAGGRIRNSRSATRTATQSNCAPLSGRRQKYAVCDMTCVISHTAYGNAKSCGLYSARRDRRRSVSSLT